MKIPVAIVLILLAAIASYIAADGMAYKMAKAHGVMKYGGLFRIQPDAGAQVDDTTKAGK